MMYSKTFLFRLAILLCFFCNNISVLFASNKIDSLIQVFESTEIDSLKARACINVTRALFAVGDERMMQFSNKLENLSTSIKYFHGLGKAFEYKAFFSARSGDFQTALDYFFKAKDAFDQSTESLSARTSVRNNIAITYNRLGQTDKEEEMIREILAVAKESNDSHSLGSAYSKLAGSLASKGQLTKSIEYYNLALKNYRKSEEIADEISCAITLQEMAHYVGVQNPKKGIELLKEAEAICLKNGDDRVLQFVYSGLMDIYEQLNDFKKVLDIGYKRLRRAEDTNDIFHIIGTATELGDIHRNLNNMDKAREYYQKSIDLAAESEYMRGHLAAINSMGNLFLQLKDYKKAIEYLKKAIDIGKDSKEKALIARLYADLGDAYFQNKNFEDALIAWEKGLAISADEASLETNQIYQYFGKYYLEKKDYSKAISFSQKAYRYAEGAEDILLMENAANVLAISYEMQADFKNALKFSKIHEFYKDSTFNENKLKEVTTMEMNYEFESEKAILAAQKEADEAILKTETRQSQTAAAGIGLLALLGFGFFWNARRQNKKITAQNTQISTQNSQLEQLNTTKDRIFAIIGHDLRKPVVAFNGISETINYLIQKEDYSTLKQLGTEIEQDGFSMQKLTDNLLNWALMQRDVMPHKPQMVALSPKVEEVFAIFEKVADDKDIELNHAIPADMEVYADGNALMTILVNLTDNALKYTPQGGQVTIEGIPTQEGIKINVTDSGVGMAAEQLKDIFLLQKDKSKKGTKGEKGTGLGLHLVSELVKMNSGNIEAKSEIGKGTTFEVQLPKGKIAA